MLILLLSSFLISRSAGAQALQRIIVSPNHRFLQYENGEPFFWLGDTGWFLFNKLNREEAVQYLSNRETKGFNVIQCMLIPHLPLVNAYGDSAFSNNNISTPLETSGCDFSKTDQYDYWDHVDYIIDEAAKHNLYIGLVCIWGNVAKQSGCTLDMIKTYTEWLVNRFKDKPNIVWINGGDLRGDLIREKWEAIGNIIRSNDQQHLITYHPFGRTQSSTWFQNASWLDFNMFQSGHRRYDQKKGDGAESWKGEDNWRYVLEDYAKTPPKPTLDGEPSYEHILQGLHDTTQPYWQAADCRRYAYWSVFAGAFGHTYGDNSVMQMYKPDDTETPAYGARDYWYEAINDTASFQMQYLKKLILSRPFFERVYDSTAIADQGTRYDFVAVTKGKNYLFAYTYTGRAFTLRSGVISADSVKACWYNPRNGESTLIGVMPNAKNTIFTPPGPKRNGNDWVLIADSVEKQ